MLRAALAVALGIAFIGFAGSMNAADEKKAETVKLEGKLTCTKCALEETKACEHALVLKKDGKEIKYYIKDKGGKEPYHAKCCQEPVDAIVTGKIVEKDGKKYIEDPKVEIKK